MQGMVTYIFFDETTNIDEMLQQVLEDPNSRVFLDCSTQGIYAARYLVQSGYRNGVLYHLGQQPKVNICQFPTKGGFSSHQNMVEQMKKDAQ